MDNSNAMQGKGEWVIVEPGASQVAKMGIPESVESAFWGIATFAGWQECPHGEAFPLYNLLIDIPGHPAGSTVSWHTLWNASMGVVI